MDSSQGGLCLGSLNSGLKTGWDRVKNEWTACVEGNARAFKGGRMWTNFSRESSSDAKESETEGGG